MALKDSFAAASKSYKFEKINDFTLYVSEENNKGLLSSDKSFSSSYEYNFFTRTMKLISYSYQVIPFSQLDPEVLEVFRDKLIKLDGDPPELPPRSTSNKAPKNGFPL